MKYTYAYKTSDGERHEATIEAESRDAVFQTLRAKGIKAIKVVAADGSKANGEVRVIGVKHRTVAIIIILSISAIAATLHFSSRSAQRLQRTQVAAKISTSPRHHIYGDPALMHELESTDYETVFTNRGDRFLAHFAQPGATPRFKSPNWRAEMSKALENKEGCGTLVATGENLPREVNELAAIVAGMRDELHAYLSDGVGTTMTFVTRLEERQQEEQLIFLRAVNELKGVTDSEIYEKRNEALRCLGLPTIPAPGE